MERHTLLSLMDEDFIKGYMRVGGTRARPANWDATVAAAIALCENHAGMSVNKWRVALEEALTTADFPLAFHDTLYRKALARYKSLGPSPLSPLFRVDTLPDFRMGKLFRKDGGVRRMQEVGEKGEFKARKKFETEYDLSLAMYGNQWDFSWQAYINDDIGIFEELPEDLADSAWNTEAWMMTNTLFTTTGPRAAFFNHATEGQMGISNLPLTAQNLAIAIAQMNGIGAGYRSRYGEPQMNDPVFLVYSPALEINVMQILHSTQVQWIGGAQNADPSLPATALIYRGTLNAIQSYNLIPIKDSWLPVVCVACPTTVWGLFSRNIKPCVVGKLRGFEEPEIYMKKSDLATVGGGDVSPFRGDFATQNIFYRGSIIRGTSLLDPRGGWASTGV